MDDPKTPSEIDERVRRLTQQDEAVVQRVLAGALRLQHIHRRRPVRWARVVALIAAMGLLGAGIWGWRAHLRGNPEATSLVITGNATFVVAERADGRRVVAASTTDRAGAGSYIIVVER